jgi:signal transduction histidine kinase
LKIAIVGSGVRCITVLEFFTSNSISGIDAEIVGIANLPKDPVCRLQAEKSAIPVFDHYQGFLEDKRIDLIIDLSDDPDTFQDILTRKQKTTRIMNFQTARLFLDMCRIHDQQPSSEQSLLRASSIYTIVMNDLIHEDVLIIAPNYQILDANNSLLAKTGLTRNEIIGRNCFEVTHHYTGPCSSRDCRCPLKETIATQKPFTTTHIHLDKDEREHHVSISCYPLMGPDGLIGAIEISKDITRDILMQRSLMQQEKLASIGRLSAGVAHEINNPLTTVLTTVMLLQEDFESGHPIHAELELIAKETLRCRDIVTALLDFARQKTPEMKPGSINETVRETVALTRKQAAFKDIELTASYDHRIPTMWIDNHQMKQALINLLINAIESTDAGGRISVRTQGDPGGEKASIFIQDSGAGIPEGLLDKVFEPFFTTKEAGTGLGLAITHGIVVQHGGEVKVTSRPKEGTLFTITLPVRNEST